MFRNLLYIIVLLLVISCSVNKNLVVSENNQLVTDSTEYELIVIETGFESWLISNSRPVWYHTHSYYRLWNIIYANEWNYRFNNSILYDAPYDYLIDYDRKIDYGIDLDHKLYWYFKFIEDKYNISLYFARQRY